MNAKSVMSRPLRKAPVARAVLTAVLVALAAMPAAWASDVTIPNTFQAYTPAIAGQVNANFGAVETAVDDNAADIAALQQQIATQAATIQTLMDELNTLQDNTVLALDGKLGLGTDSHGYDVARFTAVNVQIVNGSGQTTFANGLGNLTIGYNESHSSQDSFCSDGQWDNQTDCESNFYIWAKDLRTGSHNLVLGKLNAYSQYGGLVAGQNNIINRHYAWVLNGFGNVASGGFAVVSGGSNNVASGSYSSVSGGQNNEASGTASSVSGGRNNLASGLRSWVSGGRENNASGGESSVSGGRDNTAIGAYSSVSGGFNNTAGSTADPLVPYASVSGGWLNKATGNSSSVSGGHRNTASGMRSSVTGGEDNIASGDNSSVSGGDGRSATDDHDWAAGNLSEDN